MTWERPAVFISTLSPGYIAGGSQCTLAFLEAVCELHNGNVVYMGPPYLTTERIDSIEVRASQFVRPRNWFAKLIGVVRLSHVDRVTPFAKESIREWDQRDVVVYVNGEVGGGIVKYAALRGFDTVFIVHNYSPYYLKAERRNRFSTRRIYEHIVTKCALQGYRTATVKLLLSRYDGEMYDAAVGSSGPVRGVKIDSMYFGYKDLCACSRSSYDSGFSLLVSTNMEMMQNEEGVLYFLKEVWRALEATTNWKLVLAGRFPSERILEEAEKHKRIRVISRPSRAEMERIYRICTVSVATSFNGSGIKLRVAESLRHGLPVVSTAHCAIGYEHISAEVIRIFTTPEQAISALTDYSIQARRGLRARCLKEYHDKLSFDAGLNKMQEVGRILERRNRH